MLHDASHTAFSHVIDWVIGDPNKENYQDNIHAEFIQGSEIPHILARYGINYKEISSLENFQLLEKKAPSLCVDRFDYAIREIKDKNNQKTVNLCVSDLISEGEQLAFKSEKCAEFFGIGYAKCQREHWAGKEAKTRYYILSNILKKAMNTGVISIEDIKKTDMHVIRLLDESGDEEILEGLRLLKEGFKIEETENEEGIELRKKFRYVDPEVLVNGKIRRLSEISTSYRKFMGDEKRYSESNLKIKIKK